MANQEIFVPGTINTSGANYANVLVNDDSIIISPSLFLGSSFSFDGVNKMFSLASGFNTAWNNTIAGAGKSFTIGIWAKSNLNGATQQVIGRDNAGANRQFTIFKSSTTNRINFRLWTDNSNNFTVEATTSQFTTGSWQFWTLSFDHTASPITTGVRITRNNVVQATTVSATGTFTTLNANTTPNIEIGTRTTTPIPFNGFVHCVVLWDKVLSLPEISAAYNSGKFVDMYLLSTNLNIKSYLAAGNKCSFSTNWTWGDIITPASVATSANMVFADLTNDHA